MEKLAHGTLSSPVAPPNPRAARSSTIPGRAGPRERRARWHEAPARARPKSSSGASAAQQCARDARPGFSGSKRGVATRTSIQWKFPHSIQGFQFRPEPDGTSGVLPQISASGASTTPSSLWGGYRPRDSASPSSESRGAANTQVLHCCTRHRRPSAGLTPNFTPVAKSKDDRAVEGPLLRPLGPLIQAGVGADRRRQLRKRV